MLAAIMLVTYIFYTVLLGVVISSLAQADPGRPAGRVSSVNRLFGLIGLTAGAVLGGTLVRVCGARRPVLGGRRTAGPDRAGAPPVHDPGNAVSRPPEAPPPPASDLDGRVPFGEPRPSQTPVDAFGSAASRWAGPWVGSPWW